MTIAADTYVPGVCNINRAEIKRRRKAGYFGLALGLVLLAIMIALSLSRWVRILLFVPAFIAAIGFLQARGHFCVAYAAAGLQNASDGNTVAQAVDDTVHTQADKQRARRMYIHATVIALVCTGLTLLLPAHL